MSILYPPTVTSEFSQISPQGLKCASELDCPLWAACINQLCVCFQNVLARIVQSSNDTLQVAIV